MFISFAVSSTNWASVGNMYNFCRQRGIFVGSVVEWLTHRTDDQHGLGSKPTCAILLCSWEKHFTALSPAGGLDKQF